LLQLTASQPDDRDTTGRNHDPWLDTLDGGLRIADWMTLLCSLRGCTEGFYFLLPTRMANPSPKAERPASQDVTSSAQPSMTFRFGNVSAAIYSQERRMPTGRVVTFHHVSLRRRYCDSDGEWQSSSTLDREDLLPAAVALQNCYEYIEATRTK